jgi:hypothetical protein
MWLVVQCEVKSVLYGRKRQALERKNILPAQTLNGPRYFDHDFRVVLNYCEEFDMRTV